MIMDTDCGTESRCFDVHSKREQETNVHAEGMLSMRSRVGSAARGQCPELSDVWRRQHGKRINRGLSQKQVADVHCTAWECCAAAPANHRLPVESCRHWNPHRLDT